MSGLLSTQAILILCLASLAGVVVALLLSLLFPDAGSIEKRIQGLVGGEEDSGKKERGLARKRIAQEALKSVEEQQRKTGDADSRSLRMLLSQAGVPLSLELFLGFFFIVATVLCGYAYLFLPLSPLLLLGVWGRAFPGRAAAPWRSICERRECRIFSRSFRIRSISSCAA